MKHRINMSNSKYLFKTWWNFGQINTRIKWEHNQHVVEMRSKYIFF